jgi:hypothetical protein
MKTLTSKMDKKQLNRITSFLPDGKPRKIRCYDNGGETADRYTCVFTGSYKKHTDGEHWYLGMSGNPFHPLGVADHGGSRTQIDYPSYKHLGKKIKYDQLSIHAQLCIMQTYLYLWSFTDDDGNWLDSKGNKTGSKIIFSCGRIDLPK